MNKTNYHYERKEYDDIAEDLLVVKFHHKRFRSRQAKIALAKLYKLLIYWKHEWGY